VEQTVWMKLNRFCMVAVPLAAFILQYWRLRPFQNDVFPENSVGDDWLNYHLYAINILVHGPALHRLPVEYPRPAGFLYCYFIALIYWLLGVSSAWVYLVQGTLIGLSIVVMGFAVRDSFTPRTRFLFVATMTVIEYLDVSRWYSQKLLSENLLIILLPFCLSDGGGERVRTGRR
jgi:hypothetical protein